MSVVALMPAARFAVGAAKSMTSLANVDKECIAIRAVHSLLASDHVNVIVIAASLTAAPIATEFENSTVITVPDDHGFVDWIQRALVVARTEVPDVSVVLLHEAARPFIPPELIRRVVDATQQTGEVIVPALPCTDTVKELTEPDLVLGTPDRSTLRVIQTPQGFPIDLLERACAEQHGFADRPPLEWLSKPAHIVEGHHAAHPITTEVDAIMALAEPRNTS